MRTNTFRPCYLSPCCCFCTFCLPSLIMFIIFSLPFSAYWRVTNLLKHTFCTLRLRRAKHVLSCLHIFIPTPHPFPPTRTTHSFSGCHVAERSVSAWCGSDKRDGVCCWKQTDVVNVKRRGKFRFETPAELCAGTSVLWELLGFIHISQTEQGALFLLVNNVAWRKMSDRHLFLQTS